MGGLGLTPRTASRLLRELVVSGALEREGEGATEAYRCRPLRWPPGSGVFEGGGGATWF